MRLILSSEHGGNYVPEEFAYLFNGHKSVLETHRGYDIGSLDLYNYLGDLTPLRHKNEVSRLLVECNRSLRNVDLFSEFCRPLSTEKRIELLDNVYHPYRNKVISYIEEVFAEDKMAFHISVHTFTPVLNGLVREADIAFLFDPSRPLEKALSIKIRKQIKKLDPKLRVRFNYPYTGLSDGFTTFLRKQFPTNYIGLELEVNQKFSTENRMSQHIKNVLTIAISNSMYD